MHFVRYAIYVENGELIPKLSRTSIFSYGHNLRYFYLYKLVNTSTETIRVYFKSKKLLLESLRSHAISAEALYLKTTPLFVVA